MKNKKITWGTVVHFFATLIIWYSWLMVAQMIILTPILVMILIGLQYPTLASKMSTAMMYYVTYSMIAAIGFLYFSFRRFIKQRKQQEVNKMIRRLRI